MRYAVNRTHTTLLLLLFLLLLFRYPLTVNEVGEEGRVAERNEYFHGLRVALRCRVYLTRQLCPLVHLAHRANS